MISLFQSATLVQRAEPPSPVPPPEPESPARAVDTHPHERRPTEEERNGPLAKLELVGTLALHRAWVESRSKEGERADLSGQSLHGVDLHGVCLQDAILRKADFSSADLSFAQLQGACLVQASLQNASLLHARLRDAGLQGANLEGVSGLLPEQLAGTSLFGAALPRPLPDALFHKIRAAAAASQLARRLLWSMLAASLLCGIIVARTTDLQIVKNASVLPVPYLGAAFPVEGFFMLAPVLLLFLYLFFHVRLLRMWEHFAELPAVFADGQGVDRKVGWLFCEKLQQHSRWLSEGQLPRSSLEITLMMLPAYWVVPVTLVLFWGRYLTRLDLHASTYHAVLVAAACVVAAWLPALAEAVLRKEMPQREKALAQAGILGRSAIGLAAGAFLFALSLGTVQGVPRDARAEASAEVEVRKWAPRFLWLLGYDPYAEISELAISTPPRGWSGNEDALPSVQGARLDGRRLRYADAFRAFLVNARLRKVDFQFAMLAEADLRSAVMPRANLRSAVLDRARLERVDLQGAALHRASLVNADLRQAILAYGILVETVLIDAQLSNATLFSANLQSARLSGADLQKADLREANLSDARMAQVLLRGADLWAARLPRVELRDARMEAAILTEADLRGADLRGASMREAFLARALLDGALLEGADLRGTHGLTASQLCAAVGSRQALLDETVREQLSEACGPDAAKPHLQK
jgi:uncharacterized protein YjbI with pentapeptide repeats